MDDLNLYLNECRKANEIETFCQRRILVIEDDITYEPIWTHIIEKIDASAAMEWATSVFEAEEMIANAIASECPYSLVITDIFLSGSRTGIDLWEKYQNILNDGIVLVSGVDPLKMINYFSDKKVPVYIQKPLNIECAIETICELLQRGQSPLAK